MTNNRIGIRDVAAAAGVSVTTVSHSLSGRGVLSATTRERVRSIASDLGYAPNRLASGLRNQRSQTIGFVSDEIATTPFAGRVVLGAQEAAAEYEWVLMVVNSNLDSDLEDREIRALLQHQVDGIVYARMYHQHIVVPRVLAGVPTVLLDAESDDDTYPSVVPDEAGAAATAVEYVIRAGHTRIGYVANEDDIPAAHSRLAGYRDTLGSFGLPYDPSIVRCWGSGGCRTAPSPRGPADCPLLLQRPDGDGRLPGGGAGRPVGARRSLDHRHRQSGAHRRKSVPGPYHRRPPALRDGALGHRASPCRDRRGRR
jgi:LacI family transcriptional regulator